MKITSFRNVLLCVAVLLGLSVQPLIAQEPIDMYIIEADDMLPANLAVLVSQAGGILYREHNELDVAVAMSEDPNFAASIEAYPTIKNCTQDLLIQLVPIIDEAGNESPEELRVAGPLSVIDPTAAFFYPCQWNLHQIDAPGAWTQDHFGDPDVKVAVIDTGIDPYHIDMEGRVDINNSVSVLSPGIGCHDGDQDFFYDFNGHGAFVSGIITSNGIGIAGVAPKATIVGVKVGNCEGWGLVSDAIAGLLYAASLPDVHVINMSVFTYFPKNAPGAGRLSALINKAVNYASSKGILVVAAAGNDAINLDRDKNHISAPAQAGRAIGVWAGDIDGNLASYSNYGRSGTWVGAGGGDFTSPQIPLPGCVLAPDSQGGIISICSSFVCGSTNMYLSGFSGTSVATPAVSGVAALVDSKYGGSLNGGQLKTILSRTADDLGKPGVDNIFSHGRVNASEAVSK